MFERFMGRFTLPLMRGGQETVLVSYPIGHGAIAYFEGAQILEPGIPEAVEQARRETLSRLLPSPPAGVLDEDEIRLLAALHNVLLNSHEEIVGGLRGSTRWTHCLAWARDHLEGVAPCATAEEALGRHSVIHLAPRLTRRDVILKTRRGSNRYPGQEPPRRAMIWPKLRQVRTNNATATLPEVLDTDEARELFTEILELSPLTCLLSMPYSAPASIHQRELSWSLPVVRVLTRPELCRAVTYRHLELGFRRVGPPLSKALIEGLERLASGDRRTPMAEVLAFGLRYIVNLQMTHIWTALDEEELIAPLNQSWSSENESLAGLFFGWFVAATVRNDRIGAPAPATPEHHERETLYRHSAARIVGERLDDAARHVEWIVPPQGLDTRPGGNR